MRLLIGGGGTGGHIYPGVAVAQELMKRHGENEVMFAGSAKGIEARVMPKLGYEFSPVRCSGFIGAGLAGKAKAIFATMLGVFDSWQVIRRFKPHACLGVGGYASLPVGLAARLAGVKLTVQEQNATAGVANRVLATMATKVYAADESAAKGFDQARTLISGTPLRNEFAAALDYEPPGPDSALRILVLGGSQGAGALNELVPEGLKGLGRKVEIIHQAGPDRVESVEKHYAGTARVRVADFLDDMVGAYEWAQLVVCRAGALTVAELAAVGRPAIMIPFPHAAGDHQRANALNAESNGAAVVLDQSELDAESLSVLVRKLASDPGRLKSMADAASASGRRDAAKTIVDNLRLICGFEER